MKHSCGGGAFLSVNAVSSRPFIWVLGTAWRRSRGASRRAPAGRGARFDPPRPRARRRRQRSSVAERRSIAGPAGRHARTEAARRDAQFASRSRRVAPREKRRRACRRRTPMTRHERHPIGRWPSRPSRATKDPPAGPRAAGAPTRASAQSATTHASVPRFLGPPPTSPNHLPPPVLLHPPCWGLETV